VLDKSIWGHFILAGMLLSYRRQPGAGTTMLKLATTVFLACKKGR
jgi:hypothetical protein